MKKRITILLTIVGFTFTSCGDYLKEYSQDLSYVTSVNDLSELLVGSAYAASDWSVGTDIDFSGIHLMDDDIDESVQNDYGSTREYNGFYCFQQQPFEHGGTPTEDDVWKGLYQKIGAINTIIAEAENFSGEEGYSRVKGEAHYLRAYWYYWLINLYAQPYVKESAMREPGVPVKLSNFVDDRYYSRVPVQDVYDQIVKDLNISIEHLKGIKQSSVYRVNETAARILLSRIYLYLGEWKLALQESNEAIDDGYELKNLNIEDPAISFTNALSSETVFTMGRNPMEDQIMRSYSYEPIWPGGPATVRFTYAVSPDLLRLYAPEDLRTKFFFVTHEKQRKTLVLKLRRNDSRIASDRFLIRIPEAYLNKAEALAMLDKEDEAILTLQDFRKNRFKSGKTDKIDKTGKDLIIFIRDERRMEFCFEAQRWFDLRRYAVHPKYPESKPIVHSFTEWDRASYSPLLKGYYILPAYSEYNNNYVLPIPDYALRFNAGTLVDNNRQEIVITNKK